MNTVSVALPSVCHHVNPAGIFRSNNVRRIDARSMRSSIQRLIGGLLRLDLFGDAQPEVPILHEHRAVADLHLKLVELAWRWSGEDLARLDVELAAVTGTEKVLAILVVDVAAAEVRAVAVVG